MSGTKDFTELGKLLILSHGQVEHGFCTNVKLHVGNQNTESLIVQRIIHDHRDRKSSEELQNKLCYCQCNRCFGSDKT